MKDVLLIDFIKDFEHLKIFYDQLTDLKFKRNKKKFRTVLNSKFIEYVEFYFFYIEEYDELHMLLDLQYCNGYTLSSFNCDCHNVIECYNLIFATLLDAYVNDY